MRGKVLVLGGTGAMGIYLVPELIVIGFEVVVTSRFAKESEDSGIRYVKGDAKDLSFVREIVSQEMPDAIIDFMSYSTSEFTERRDLLLSGTLHYLFLSSYRVFADTDPELLTERSPRLLDVCSDAAYLKTDEYALAKARQENLLRESGRRNWTILRPCITYSRNRFQLGTLEADSICCRALQGLPVIMAREVLAKQTTMTWAGDVAKLIGRLVLNSSAFSEDYNVVTAEHQTWAQVATYYEDAIKLQIRETDLETYVAVVGAAYQVKYDRMLNRCMDNAKVLEATGLSQSDFLPLQVGLKKELAAFCVSPLYPRMNVEVNARMDRFLGTRISLARLSAQERMRYWLAKHFPKLKKTSLLYRRLLYLCSVVGRLSGE